MAILDALYISSIFLKLNLALYLVLEHSPQAYTNKYIKYIYSPFQNIVSEKSSSATHCLVAGNKTHVDPSALC